MLLEKLREEEEVKSKSTEETLFLNFYNTLMNYEKENRVSLISERVRDYINALIVEMTYLERITGHGVYGSFSENSIVDLKEDFDVAKEKINFIINEDFEEKTEDILENVILNTKLELLPKIEEYSENLKISYEYHKNIKSNFNSEVSELQKEFNYLIENKNKEFLKELKERISRDAKNILKERKINLEDISSEDVNFIKNDILQIDKLNNEIFDIYLEIENKANNLFNDIRESLEIEDNEASIDKNLLDIIILNKRYFKFIENNHSLIRNKLINDIQSKLGAESIENKLEIELIYAQDLIKGEYINKLNEFCGELRSRNNLSVYKRFRVLYGDMLTVEEQINLLDSIYLKVKELDFIKFSHISLIDYLNHSKQKR